MLLLKVFFAGMVIVGLHILFDTKEDLMPKNVLLSAAEEEDDDDEESFPTEPQIYKLAFRPTISGNGGTKPFGPFYDDDATPPYDAFTMLRLWESGDAQKRSAVLAAQEWIMTHQKEIFETVFLLKYAEPEIKKAIRLVRIQQAAPTYSSVSSDGALDSANIEMDSTETTPIVTDTFHIVVQEQTAGGAHSHEIRRTLRDNVQSGGDTYECGDWGDISDGSAMVRVSFSNLPVDWDPPLPPKKCPNTSPFVYRGERLPYTFHRMW